MKDLKCADCGSDMEVGSVPALSPFRFLDANKGEKADQREAVPITAHRCTDCGALRLYAKLPDNA